MTTPQSIHVPPEGNFPNSHLPVLYYPQALTLPRFFSGRYVRQLFRKNGWRNNWRSGIFTYHHYHSTAHEVIGFIEGRTSLQLGGISGPVLRLQKFDVLVIPAGVAHKNLGGENDVICIGGYPDGRNYDMNYGTPRELPSARVKIAAVPVPSTDPITGQPLTYWT
ncbi:cupin [Chitinophaga horti]|uniref:Cupin n=1 Tax=Chitinophaga horti TaxID=2920382 RepID=A0ABY6J869_9BACT|nr:cupin [Chitinophaga horti]UYQ95869.1 cupin [Chitinophaga horti]